MDELLVHPQTVRAALDRGEAIVFLDVRSPSSWAASVRQMPGAIRLPLDEVGAHADALPRDREVVAYCTGQNQATSARAARILRDHGHEHAHVLQWGFRAWLRAHYAAEPKPPRASPTGAGACPECGTPHP
jgi:rhodanese-related sulfurtransferase